MEDLKKRIEEMLEYLTIDAVAEALKMTPEAVEAVLKGEAEIEVKEGAADAAPVIHVKTTTTAYRQKVLAVVRAKGGVGATSVAIGLARALCEQIKVLQVDIFPFPGLPDSLSFLGVDITEYPSHSPFQEQAFYKIQPMWDLVILRKADELGKIMATAKQNYDAIVIDTPNEASCVLEALKQANTVVFITAGHIAEDLRLANLANTYGLDKDIYVFYRTKHQKLASDISGSVSAFVLDFEPEIEKTFKRGDIPSLKTNFMKTINRAKDAIYQERKGLLSKLFY